MVRGRDKKLCPFQTSSFQSFNAPMNTLVHNAELPSTTEVPLLEPQPENHSQDNVCDPSNSPWSLS